jgi:hypothetical protein
VVEVVMIKNLRSLRSAWTGEAPVPTRTPTN